MGMCCSQPEKTAIIDFNSKLYKPVDYQQRLEEILDFWFRSDDDDHIGGIHSSIAYDREQSLPQKFMMRWFK